MALLLLAVTFRPVVEGDGVSYYAYLHAVLVSHDLDFANEYSAAIASHTPLYPPLVSTRTATGHLANFFPVGPAILSGSAYLAALGLRNSGEPQYGSPFVEAFTLASLLYRTQHQTGRLSGRGDYDRLELLVVWRTWVRDPDCGSASDRVSRFVAGGGLGGPVAVAADGTLLVGNGGAKLDSPGAISYSTNSGTTWSPGIGLPYDQSVEAIAGQATSTTLYAYCYGGDLYASTDGGRAWTLLSRLLRAKTG